MIVLSCLLLLLSTASALERQPSEQGPRLQSPKPTLLDGFGFSVSVEGNQVLVGAPHATGTRGSTGKAFLFERESGKLLRKFVPSSTMGDDLFGLSVSLTPDYVIVGAPRGKGALRRSVGSVTVFDRNTGESRQVIVSPNQSAAAFGHAVAARDGLVAVGDPGASTMTDFEVGEVHLVDVTTGEVLRTFVSPYAENRNADGFGHAVTFLGSILAVGAPLGGTDPVDHGQVFLFDWQSGRLKRTLVSPDPQTNEYFGWALASDAELLVVGALGRGGAQPESGVVYLYTKTREFLRTLEAPEPGKGDHFGEAVALLPGHVIVGAPGHDAAGIDAGSIFVFDRKTGTLQSMIVNPSETTGVADLFGLSLSGAGRDLVVGSPYGDLEAMPDAGLVHQFRLPVSPGGM
ncbi:MAG: hypothetical protein OXI53_10090 [Nitrospira sp.]|nr:hypothetical protein [Nitrospira sp.]MDE0487219.1 hypothetical protein [Nitrospira sp.]